VVNGELAAIDFQDALHGPITYDPVSLFRDCYVVWPEEKVRGWVADYWRMLSEKHKVSVSEIEFQRWFDFMSLQRHIKVLGIFARLSIRDNKHGYLQDLPTVVRYVMQVAAQHGEAKDFYRWFTASILPLAKAQPWGADL
jgi:aminoglycoside/choline kinase family phosphotransferase